MKTIDTSKLWHFTPETDLDWACIKGPGGVLLAVKDATAAHADDGYVKTYTMGEPCPSGPGMLVYAQDENGNVSYAGCWGDPMPEREHHDENHQRRTYREQEP